MQRIYIPVLVIIVTIAAACKKNNITTNDPNNVPGLPPTTQSGANTFGCLVNGVPWVPQGSNGTNNLSIDYDPGFNNGIFSISAQRILSVNQTTSIGIGIRDSLNFVTPPKKYILSRNSLFGVYYHDFNGCMFGYFDSTISKEGWLLISTYNKNNGIISGTFEATLIKNACDTIRITKGRFDFKF